MQEIIFSVLVILSYFATGIASAAYAAAWSAPPDLCEFFEDIPNAEDDPCNTKPLTATTALQAVSRSKEATFRGVIPRG